MRPRTSFRQASVDVGMIRPIGRDDFDRVHAMQTTYLDGDSREEFEKRVAEDPDLYVVSIEGEALTGICYGRIKQPRGNAVLNGICADLDNGFGRKGIGTALLRAFEDVLRKRGCAGYSVGSAPDPKVESFYIKNGFYPIELVAKSQTGG